jgi:hypothetical protein
LLTSGRAARTATGAPSNDLRFAVAAHVLLVVLVGATAALIIGFDVLGPGGRVAAAILAFGAFGALFSPRVRVTLTRARVLIVAGALLVIAVLAPPVGSHDLWSYAAYGRLVSTHHVSPFTHVPAAYPHDPMFHLIARGWRHTGSVYGPGFVAMSAVGTAATGGSQLATRLFFQVLEAAALGAALLIIWRRTRDPLALAFIALNPALIVVVNGGHNDIVVGLALLAGTLLLTDGHPREAGLVLGAGALVKLVLVLPLGALLIWAWRRRGPRAAVEVGATASALLLGAYLAAGGLEALGPLLRASRQHSRSSLWQIATQWLASPLDVHRSTLFAIEGGAALALITMVVVLVVLSATRGAARPASDESTGAIVAGTAALVYLLAGAYVLPWYSAWALPVLALVWNSHVAVLAAGQAALISVAYAAPLILGGVVRGYAQDVVPVLLLGALTHLVVSAWRGRLGLRADAPRTLPTEGLTTVGASVAS